jgi:hypothetical protein
VEYVDVLDDAESGSNHKEPMCMFCRDGIGLCPGCKANDTKPAGLAERLLTPELPKRKQLPKEEPMQKALDDATIDKAVALRKDGLSTSKIADKLGVQAYRLYQSIGFQNQTKGLPHPNALRTERMQNKARSPRGAVATALKPAAVDAPLKAMREDCLEKIAKLQELVDAIDRVLAF